MVEEENYRKVSNNC